MEGKKATCPRSSEGRVELNKETPWLHHRTAPQGESPGRGPLWEQKPRRGTSSVVAAIRDACLQVSAPRGQLQQQSGRAFPEMERLEDELGI